MNTDPQVTGTAGDIRGGRGSVSSTQNPLIQLFKSGLNKNRILFSSLSFSLIVSEMRGTNDPCLTHFVEDKGTVPTTASGLGTHHAHYSSGYSELMEHLTTRGPQNQHGLLAISLEIFTAGGAS